jgi:cytochrome P450
MGAFSSRITLLLTMNVLLTPS